MVSSVATPKTTEKENSKSSSFNQLLQEKLQEPCSICLNGNINNPPEILCLCCGGICHCKCYDFWMSRNGCKNCPCCGTHMTSYRAVSDCQINSQSHQNESASNIQTPVNTIRRIPQRVVPILSGPWTSSADTSITTNPDGTNLRLLESTWYNTLKGIAMHIWKGLTLCGLFLCSFGAIPCLFLATWIIICKISSNNNNQVTHCPNKFIQHEPEEASTYSDCTIGIAAGILYFISFVLVFETVYSHFRPS